MAQFAQGFSLDLANALSGDRKRPANLLQCMFLAILYAIAHPLDLLLSRGER